MKTALYLCILLGGIYAGAAETGSGNTITREVFNFGHQSGYMYSRMDNAYFKTRGEWSVETGFLAYYTKKMPLVTNPYWQERLMLLTPLYFELFPCNTIALQIEVTDIFIEFPYRKAYDSFGAKSPRFKTKIRLVKERRIAPAVALTVGVKFSSAKPVNIWHKRHNYEESNGLAGPGTGEADYCILVHVSKKITSRNTLHARLGLAPLGSPVEYERGSAQADEIPYGVSWELKLGEQWSIQNELCGMYNGLPHTTLAHYSVIRSMIRYRRGKSMTVLDLERGLTEESDDWVVGIYQRFNFRLRRYEFQD
jgi:hypothetical protein